MTEDRKKAYIRYCVFSWGVPCVVVAICVTLQLTKTGNVGYGKLIRASLIMLHKLVPNFQSFNEILKCDKRLYSTVENFVLHHIIHYKDSKRQSTKL